MSRFGWSLRACHPEAGEMVLPIDDQTLAYEAEPFVRALCSMFAPCRARVSIAQACAVPSKPTVDPTEPTLFDEVA